MHLKNESIHTKNYVLHGFPKKNPLTLTHRYSSKCDVFTKQEINIWSTKYWRVSQIKSRIQQIKIYKIRTISDKGKHQNHLDGTRQHLFPVWVPLSRAWGDPDVGSLTPATLQALAQEEGLLPRDPQKFSETFC